jgi:hypothetical protein
LRPAGHEGDADGVAGGDAEGYEGDDEGGVAGGIGGDQREETAPTHVEVPSRKRLRAASPEMTDEGFRKGLLKVLGEIEGHLGKLASASDRWVEAKADRKGKKKAEEWEYDAEEVEIEDRSSFVEGSGQTGGSGRSEEFEEESGVAEQMVKDL